MYFASSQRAYSIKTRIKTQHAYDQIYQLPCLREHIPLKQGLRLSISALALILFRTLREHIPLKQGLRP